MVLMVAETLVELDQNIESGQRVALKLAHCNAYPNAVVIVVVVVAVVCVCVCLLVYYFVSRNGY